MGIRTDLTLGHNNCTIATLGWLQLLQAIVHCLSENNLTKHRYSTHSNNNMSCKEMDNGRKKRFTLASQLQLHGLYQSQPD